MRDTLSRMDLPTFRASFPEFNRAPDPLVAAKLQEAHSLCDPGAWADLRDIGVGLWTAHQLTLTPEGKDLRAKGDGNGSVYKTRFDMYQAIAGFGPLVV